MKIPLIINQLDFLLNGRIGENALMELKPIVEFKYPADKQ